jgi:molybdenum cofactor cytidylyltransferase
VIFGPTPLAEAEGAILAHTLRLPERVLRKGSVLDGAAVVALRQAGYSEVIAARLEPGDVGENEAADRLANALAAPLTRRSRAATGRVNLAAEQAGLLVVDAARIDRLNAVHEALTVGTLPNYTPVAPRDMVATIKVIPFSVPGAVLAEAEAIARDWTPPFQVHPFRPLKAGLVLTELPGLKEAVANNTIDATRARIAGLTGSLLPPLRCPHREEPIAKSLEILLSQGADVVMVAGASAVVDRRDVGPMGIVRAGGEIRHFGMPVDPGNLICIGQVGTVPALVLPGCAGSPRPNGIDFVLQRIYAGLDVGGHEVTRMGVGGLLKDTTARPLPRAKATEAPVQAQEPRRPAIAAVVLAAGLSSRMAPQNKLLLPDRGGKPMVARVVDNVLSSHARPVLVVVGHQSDAVRDALGGRPVTYVAAEDYAQGLSASLKAGIAALPGDVAAAVVCLGDMPLVTGRIIDRLIEAYDPDEGRLIVLPTHNGKQGNPILWDRRFFPEILALSGDVGARHLLARHAEEIAEVEIETDAVLRDFDTVESLATLPQRLRPVEVRS